MAAGGEPVEQHDSRIDVAFPVASLAPSSPSRLPVRAVRHAAARLTWEALAVDVRWRVSLPVVIVTHLSPGRLGHTEWWWASYAAASAMGEVDVRRTTLEDV
jgi:hypothetical protein